MPGLPSQFVYTPSTGPVTQAMDRTMWGAAYLLSRELGVEVQNIGCRTLGGLTEGGGQIFVVGHGNAGSAIGTHAEHYDPEQLRDLLAADGLPKSPKDTVTVHLYACATGTSVRRSYALWRREPFAKRFADKMASAGFNDCYVVGYCGFMSPGGKHSLKYHASSADKREWLGDNRGDAPTIVFRVNAGACAQVSGDAWKQTLDIRVHRARANSYVMNIVPA